MMRVRLIAVDRRAGRRRRSCSSSSARARATTTRATTRSARSSATPSRSSPGEDVKISGVKVGKISDARRHARQQGRGRPRHHRAGLQGLPQGRDLHDPPAVADRRALRRVHADPARAPRATRPRPSSRRSRTATARASTCCRDSQTIKPVDIDLVGNIMRLPYRQRLSIIINELGTGLAANGAALREADQGGRPGAASRPTRSWRSSPTRTRRSPQLAKNGDEVLAPLARDKDKVADFIDKADTTAVASRPSAAATSRRASRSSRRS